MFFGASLRATSSSSSMIHCDIQCLGISQSTTFSSWAASYCMTWGRKRIHLMMTLTTGMMRSLQKTSFHVRHHHVETVAR